MQQPYRPRFKRCFDVEIIEPDRVHLISETDTLVLENRLLHMLSPTLDGRSTVEEIAERLEDRISILDVEHGLALLEASGCLEEDGTAPTPVPIFALPPTVEITTEAVQVSAFGALPVDEILSRLQSVGLRIDPEGALQIVLVEDYLQDELREFGDSEAARERAWLPVNPTGTLFWIGPLFCAGVSPCYDCLARRLEANRRFLRGRNDTNPPLRQSAYRFSSASSEAFDALTSLALAWATPRHRDALDATMITIDVLSGRQRRHPIVARPSCRRCGTPRDPGRSPAPIALEPRRKVDLAGGGHRAALPEETLRRVGRHLSPITGIVPSLKQVLGGSSGPAHVWTAGHNLARGRGPHSGGTAGIRSLCAGKGIDATRARLGAICEALERQSGVFRGDERVKTGSYAALQDRAIHPNDFLLFSEAQYEERHRWNETESSHNWVPEPFDAERPIAWTPAWSLSAQTFRLLPTGYCYYAYPECEPYYRPDSNGCAAGNTIEEAILQGFLELVERDSVAIWWYQRLRRPAVRLETFEDAYLLSLRDHYIELGRNLRVLDVTSDLGIPTVAALSMPEDRRSGGTIVGFGAHLDPAVAVSRALTEMNQFLPATLRGGPRGRDDGVFDEKTTDLSWLTPDPDRTPIEAVGFVNRASDDLRRDVETCVGIAARHGLETIVLDQTRPDLDLTVVKVIVPGLRPFWARFGPGRLWQVPLEMGWLVHPPREEELNPLHIAF